MNFTNRKTQLLLVIIAIAIALTTLAVIKVTEQIVPTRLPLLPTQPGGPAVIEPPPATSSVIVYIYNTSPYLAPLAWVAFALTLLWKGKIRSLWLKKGYDYDAFKLLARMRGSDNRIKILRNLSVPKSRLQLAHELSLDWKAVDAHVNTLIEYNLVKEVVSVGTAKYLMITDRGKQVLELLNTSKADHSKEK